MDSCRYVGTRLPFRTKVMPATSKAQQRFMGMVHSTQKGEKPASPAVAKTAKSIKPDDAKDFASTKHKGLPARKEEELREYVRKAVREALSCTKTIRKS